MQTSYFWYKLYLHRLKVIAVVLFLGSSGAFAQNRNHDNLSDYDEQWIHYGFLMSIHSSQFRINYAPSFTTPAMDSIHSIVPHSLGGFKLGFVVNMFMFQYLDFRILPTVGFYENQLSYRFVDGTPSRKELKDATMMELPLLLKYKSVRRDNIAMYIVGGLNPQFEAAGKGDESSVREKLELRNFNLAFDIGLGLDLYFPLFKFSPEIRYSYGFRNMLSDKVNIYNENLDRLVTNNFAFFITFEGGPNYLKNRKKRGKSTKMTTDPDL